MTLREIIRATSKKLEANVSNNHMTIAAVLFTIFFATISAVYFSQYKNAWSINNKLCTKKPSPKCEIIDNNPYDFGFLKWG